MTSVVLVMLRGPVYTDVLRIIVRHTSQLSLVSLACWQAISQPPLLTLQFGVHLVKLFRCFFLVCSGPQIDYLQLVSLVISPLTGRRYLPPLTLHLLFCMSSN